MKLSYLLLAACLWLSGIPAQLKAQPLQDSLSILVKSNPVYALRILGNEKKARDLGLQYYYFLAAARQNLGEYAAVDSLLDAVLSERKITDDSSLYIRFLILDAENNKVLDRFDEAFVLLSEALRYREARTDPLGRLEIYLSLAEYFRATDNYEMALAYLQKARLVGEKVAGGFPPLLKAQMLNRKAAVYLQQARFLDSVEMLSKEVIRIGTAEGDANQVATSSNELGFLYLNIGRPEAEFYLKQAITIWEGLDYAIYANNARLNLARYYSRFGAPQKAIAVCEESLKTIRAKKWYWEEGNAYEVISQSYLQLGNYQKAYEYSEMAKEKLLYNARNQYKARVAYYVNKLKLKEKEDEINAKSREVVTAQQALKQQSRANKLLIALLAFTFVVAIGTTLGIVVNNRQKKLLARQKAEIGEINQQLAALVEQKELLLKEVNHRVKNNLGMLAGLMYLEKNSLTDPAAIASLQKILGRINTISLIHETLYQRDDMEHVDFQSYLVQLWERNIHLAQDNIEVDMQIQCEGLNPPLSHAIPLAMMINELMTNSLKHAFKNVAHPSIKLVYDIEKYELLYMDNGPGFDTGTAINTFGRSLVNIFARQINASIRFEQMDNYFATIILLAKSIT